MVPVCPVYITKGEFGPPIPQPISSMTEPTPTAFTAHVISHLRAVAAADASEAPKPPDAPDAPPAPEAPEAPKATEAPRACMRVLRLRCGTEVFGVHAFIASFHSAYLRTACTTRVGVEPAAFDVEGGPAALARVVDYMYTDTLPAIHSVEDAVATLRVANFLQIQALERACCDWIENWVDAIADDATTRVARDADVALCASLWALLDEEALAPYGHPLKRTLRVVLVDMLAQRHVADPVVRAALRSLTLPALARLTRGGRETADGDDDDDACPILAIELALAWAAEAQQHSEHSGHSEPHSKEV